MQPRTEAQLEDALFGRWLELRQAGRFDNVLPSCLDQTWNRDNGTVGYKTLDHRIHRQLRLPGAWGKNRVGIADLVETYWSVRVRDGIQDLNWAPSLNAHVIELKNEPLQVRHLDQLYRYVAALRGALYAGAINRLGRNERAVQLHVKGLLLGPTIPEPIALIDALATFGEVPIAVARFTLDPLEGIEIQRTGSEESLFEVGIFDFELLSDVGYKLVSGDHLMCSQGIWAGPEAQSQQPNLNLI